MRAHRVPRAGRVPRPAPHGGAAAGDRVPALRPTSTCLPPQPDSDGPARAVHHVDHAAAAGARRAAAGRCSTVASRTSRSTASSSCECRTVARTGRGLPGRRGCAGRAAAEPAHPRTRARRCSCRPATCTPTCTARPWRSWPTPTTCCAAGSRPSTSTCRSCCGCSTSPRRHAGAARRAEPARGGVYRTPAPEFELSRFEWDGRPAADAGQLERRRAADPAVHRARCVRCGRWPRAGAGARRVGGSRPPTPTWCSRRRAPDGASCSAATVGSRETAGGESLGFAAPRQFGS